MFSLWMFSPAKKKHKHHLCCSTLLKKVLKKVLRSVLFFLPRNTMKSPQSRCSRPATVRAGRDIFWILGIGPNQDPSAIAASAVSCSLFVAIQPQGQIIGFCGQLLMFNWL
jgi:hypothetical protein